VDRVRPGALARGAGAPPTPVSSTVVPAASGVPGDPDPLAPGKPGASGAILSRLDAQAGAQSS
jgi:hypothetical protein